MKLGAACIAALALAWPVGGWACSPVRYTSDLVAYPRTDFARVMWERAASVDVAVAESARPLDVDRFAATALADALRDEPDARRRRELRLAYAATARGLKRDGAATVTFRSIERLKGDGPGTFQLAALWNPRLSLDFPRTPTFPTTEEVYYSLSGPSELIPSAFALICGYHIAAGRGQTFLIFRGADGHLLRDAIPFVWTATGEAGASAGFPYLRLSGPADPWLVQVRQAAR